MQNARRGPRIPHIQRWVVKAGSQLICMGGPLLLRAWMQQIAVLKRIYNVEVIWVTSGAIASAVERTGFKRRNQLPEKQALSAIGQPLIMEQYNLALQATGLLGSQILLSYGDLKNRERLSNFKNTITQLLEWGIVPILNENDAVATEEIKFGDNDSLSARVAQCVDADRLVILTDVQGLYDKDPSANSRAKLVKKITKLTPDLIEGVAPKGGLSRGTGGMYSKLKAAQFACSHRIPTWLVKGDSPSILLHIAEGKALGTFIEGKKKK